MVGGDVNQYTVYSVGHDQGEDLPPGSNRDGLTEEFSVNLEPLYERAEIILTGGFDMPNEMETAIATFIENVEAEGKKLFPAVEAGIEEVMSVFAKVAPMLQEVDALIAPFLKSTKATTANATALTILNQVSDVAQAVNNSAAAIPPK